MNSTKTNIIKAIVVGPFTGEHRERDIDSVIRVQRECGHNAHLLIADGDTIWLYQQTSKDDADHLTIEDDGSVMCDDSHRIAGSEQPRRIGTIIRRVFNK